MQHLLLPVPYGIVACYILITDQVTISCPLKTTKNKGNTKKLISRKEILESSQETGPKAEKGEDRRSNMNRQNNKRTDRKMKSNDSPEIPDRGETSEESGIPLGQTNGGV